MSYKDVKFGTGFLGGNELPSLIKMSRKAEELGFSSCWIAEDYFYGGAFSTATACALNTSSIKIGIGVINPYTRHPALTSMEVGALDVASKGRTILGIGASNKRWMQEQAGIPFKKPLAAMKESVEIIRGLLAGETVCKKGEYFDTGEIKLEFKPYRPQIPIYLGVKGPKALKMAAEIGDGVLMSIMTSAPYVKYVREEIRKAVLSVGRSEKDIKLAAYLAISISENREKARNLVKPMLAKYFGIHGVHKILTCTGMPEEDILRFREAMLQKEDASDLVNDWMIDTFAVAGTPRECRLKIKELVEAGLDHPIAFEIPGVSMEETMEQVHRYIISE
ncbi:MAG: LLM class flavin-dependent oxidoreductase [Tepidanaerobacteraceae bacterium]|nr:LLM class flavin-dependent oxidoreductase [Tepidanaerobacteraceae bacterium]